MNRTKQDLADIAVRALVAITNMTTMPKREHEMWTLAINRVRQTVIDIKADEEIAERRKPLVKAPGA